MGRITEIERDRAFREIGNLWIEIEAQVGRPRSTGPCSTNRELRGTSYTQ